MQQPTSLTRQRWQRFKQHRRGYIAFWILIVLLLISLAADLLANDKPLLIYYQQHYYLPLLHDYPETLFGGELSTATNYQDPLIRQQITTHGWLIEAPIPYRYDTLIYDTQASFPTAPSAQHWLGTTDNGFDLLANILYGLRISLLFALLLTVCTSVIGIAVGAVQGYFGGKIDLLGQRVIEIWSGLPQLFIIILLCSILKPSFLWLLLINIAFGWMGLVPVVRAEFLRTRNFDYVRAAKAMGAGNVYIMWRHILPNATVATLTYLPFILCGAITILTTLDFLGFGLPLDAPSLGRLLLQGKNNLQAPWLGISTFVLLSTLLTLLIFIGEAARDAFDPRQRGAL